MKTHYFIQRENLCHYWNSDNILPYVVHEVTLELSSKTAMHFIAPEKGFGVQLSVIKNHEGNGINYSICTDLYHIKQSWLHQ